MKKILSLVFINIIMFSCSKKDIQSKYTLDYSQVKLKSRTHSLTSFTGTSANRSFDTSTYTYAGTEINWEMRRSTGATTNFKLTLSNNLYTQQGYFGSVPSNSTIYYQQNANGQIEKEWVTNSGATKQTTNYSYNPDKTKSLEKSDYTQYINFIRPHYENGTASYAILERISNSPSVSNARDSIVYEYYNNLPFRADFFNTGLPVSALGSPAKNLIKKATYYNTLNNNVIRQAFEYAYETDNDGLITKKILSVFTMPGNVLALTETIDYTYYK